MERKREGILHAISWDIWAPAEPIKGFPSLRCFWVDFASNVTRAEWKARRANKSIRGLYAFSSLVDAADALEWLNKQFKPAQTMMQRKQTAYHDACACLSGAYARSINTPLILHMYELVCVFILINT